ncbi:MAG TPA: DUF3137 domain-containing protein [Chitinophagales bacterium]|nr:DUF3137 domain-containing protein [Chitinophagales bacterium]
MHDAAAFEAFYRQEIVPDLDRLEKIRKEQLKRVTFMWSSAIISLVLAFLLTMPVLVVIFLFIALGVYFYLFGFNRKRVDFKTEYKRVVIGKLATYISDQLVFTPNIFIPESTYNQSKIFLSDPDIYSGEDLVTGKIGNTQIQFCELHTKDRQTDSRGRTTYVTIFKGIFFIADFNKHFNGQTYVLSDFGERFLGAFGRLMQSINVGRPDVVRLEDPEFEKEFVVYSSDPVEARYILSPAMMQRLLEYRKKTGSKIQCSFLNNNIYLAMPMKENLFEPSLRKSVMTMADVEGFYKDLLFCTSIVDELDLNTRIWTKE